MIHIQILQLAIETVIGVGRQWNDLEYLLMMAVTMVGFGRSLCQQLEVCFSLIRNKDRKFAAMAVMILPMMFIFFFLLVSSMGMSHFLTTYHNDGTISSIERLMDTILFSIETLVLSILLLLQVKKVLQLRPMKRLPIIISFGVQLVTACVSIVMVILDWTPFDLMGYLYTLPQIVVRLYVYGIYMVVVTVIATALALMLHSVFGERQLKAVQATEDLEPWESPNEKKVKMQKNSTYIENQKVAKQYIMGNKPYFFYGWCSVGVMTLLLGLDIRFVDGSVLAGNILLICSLLYPVMLWRLMAGYHWRLRRRAYHTLIHSDNPQKWVGLFVEEVVKGKQVGTLIHTQHFTYACHEKTVLLHIKKE